MNDATRALMTSTGAPAPLSGREITRVMILDDNPEMYALLKARVEATGLVVPDINRDLDAIGQVREASPDIVFLDVNRHRPDGEDLLSEIRAERVDVAVILTAALGMKELASTSLEDRTENFLRKPFTGAEFRVVLDRAISRLTLTRQDAVLRRHLGVKEKDEAPVPTSSGFQVGSFDLAARCVLAEKGEVGGDFCEWLELTPMRLSLVVGDVMGKGVSAALMMATVSAVMRAVVPQNTPAAALRRAAVALEPDFVRSGSFVTLFHAQLDVGTCHLRCADAGHGFVFLKRADGTMDSVPHVGLPLGVSVQEAYDEDDLSLCAGDVLIVYSDGLSQANPSLLWDQQAFGASIDTTGSAADIADRLVAQGRSAGALTDDLTVAVLKCGASVS